MHARGRAANDFSWRQAAGFRLTRHHFLTAKNPGVTAICRDICGMQAQIMAAARIGLWTRVHATKPEDLHAALWEKRTLLKTHSMRRTLHFLPSSDFPIYQKALRTSRMNALLRVMARFGLSQKDAEALNSSLLEALTGGTTRNPKFMTRNELTAWLRPGAGRNLRAWMDRVSNIFVPALTEGLICYGPDQGQEVTFVRMDRWLENSVFTRTEELEAQRILLQWYLAAYGPANLQDFSKWSGIPIRDARPVWNALEDELSKITVEGNKAWILRRDFDALAESGFDQPMVRLLAHFDPLLLAHAEKDHLIEEEYKKRVYRNQGWITPVVLVNGTIAGIWNHTTTGKTLQVAIEPFKRLSKKIQMLIRDEAAGLGQFLGREVHVSFQ